MQASAGWAEIDITPPPGLPLGGRGAVYTPGNNFLDPLAAQALVLDDGHNGRLLFVSLDLVGMSEALLAPLVLQLAAVSGVAPAGVIVNFSHTHSAPATVIEAYADATPKSPTHAAYERQLSERLAGLAAAAVDASAPATVRRCQTTSEIGINRRLDVGNGFENRPNPAGFCNRELDLFDIRTEAGRALLFCYGCHSVVVYSWLLDAVSADWPGATRARLREALGAEVHCQFLQGLAGNVRPRVLADLANHAFRAATAADLDAVGAACADAVLAGLQTAGTVVTLDIAAVRGHALLPRAEVQSDDYWQELAASPSPLYQTTARYWLRRLAGGPPLATHAAWPVGLVRLAPAHHLALLGGEPFAEWLPLLRHWLELPELTALGYCGGLGYYPVDACLAEGGYEITQAPRYHRDGPAPLAPGVEAIVRRTFRQLHAQLLAG